MSPKCSRMAEPALFEQLVAEVFNLLIADTQPLADVVLHRSIISNALFQECEAVQGRESVRADCPLSAAEIRDLLNAYYSVCRWVPIYFLWRPNLRDEGDNFLVELAVAGNADLIITNNPRDLRAAELSFPGLSITTPSVLLTGESPWRP